MISPESRAKGHRAKGVHTHVTQCHNKRESEDRTGQGAQGGWRFLMNGVSLYSGVPHVQGYLAHKKTPTRRDPTVESCLGSYGGPMGGGGFL